jgi:hypothetical protein
MILESPHYEGLSIYVGEKPIAGSFYCPKAGDALSFIANWAYCVGSLPLVLRINKSVWNRANCVYRKKSTSCSAEKVSSALALSQNSFSDGAWLALCQVDKQEWAKSLGLNYPVIWVPGPGGEEPEDLELKPKFEPPTASFTPGDPGTGTVVISDPGGPSMETGIFDEGTEEGGEAEGSWVPWAIGLGVLLLVGGGGYYLYKNRGK